MVITVTVGFLTPKIGVATNPWKDRVTILDVRLCRVFLREAILALNIVELLQKIDIPRFV